MYLLVDKFYYLVGVNLEIGIIFIVNIKALKNEIIKWAKWPGGETGIERPRNGLPPRSDRLPGQPLQPEQEWSQTEDDQEKELVGAARKLRGIEEQTRKRQKLAAKLVEPSCAEVTDVDRQAVRLKQSAWRRSREDAPEELAL